MLYLVLAQVHWYISKGHIKGIQKKSLSNGNHNVNNVIIKYFYIVKLNKWNILLLYK